MSWGYNKIHRCIFSSLTGLGAVQSMHLCMLLCAMFTAFQVEGSIPSPQGRRGIDKDGEKLLVNVISGLQDWTLQDLRFLVPEASHLALLQQTDARHALWFLHSSQIHSIHHSEALAL